MTSHFLIGQKVICVNDTYSPKLSKQILKEKEIYEVVSIWDEANGGGTVWLTIKNREGEMMEALAIRFIPAIELPKELFEVE